MALLAEEIVEEWLNRQGFFTIRGIKVGVYEMDILAIKPLSDGGHDRRHIEVQASINQISYISKVPKKIQEAKGIGPDNAKHRPPKMLEKGVKEYVEKKFLLAEKDQLRQALCSGDWTFEMVVNDVKHPEELDVFKEHGIQIYRLTDLVAEMSKQKTPVRKASGEDLLQLVLLGKQVGQEHIADIESGVSAKSEAAKIQRDANGVILNAEQLTVDDVVKQKVQCPACQDYVFETWPYGWDAHAEFKCKGLEATSSEQRKVEFKEKYGHLFR